MSFSYKKGHICFFESQDIFHYVAKFGFPPYYSDRDKVTPGRIGSVFFSAKLPKEKLEEKPKNWAVDEWFGQHPPPIR
jgi:hypothetical protein